MQSAWSYASVCNSIAKSIEIGRLRDSNQVGEIAVVMVGLLFSRPQTPLGKSEIIPNLGYFHHRSGNFIDFFLAGYREHREGWATDECEYQVDDNWSFNVAAFDNFRKEIESRSKWRYSGQSDLILSNAKYDYGEQRAALDFSSSIVCSLEQMKELKAITSAETFFETIFRFAEDTGGHINPTQLFSDQRGLATASSALKRVLLSFLPKGLGSDFLKATHLATKDISVVEAAYPRLHSTSMTLLSEESLRDKLLRLTGMAVNECRYWNDWRIQNPTIKIDLRGADLQDISLFCVDLSGADLQRAILKKAYLSCADFTLADLREVDFQGADLSYAVMKGARLQGANFRQVELWSVNLENQNLKGVDFTGAKIGMVNLIGASIGDAIGIPKKWKIIWDLVNNDGSERNLNGVDLRWAILKGASLSGTTLTNADLRMADLISCSLRRATLNGANLDHAKLDNAELCHAIMMKCDLSCAEMVKTNLDNANLVGAKLIQANLLQSFLRDSDMTSTDLRWANLTGANMTGATLTGANLRLSKLRGTIIRNVVGLADKWKVVWEILNEGGAGRDLSGFDLSYANLDGADLRGAILVGTNLQAASLVDADLTDANLTDADFTRGEHHSAANLLHANLTRANLTNTNFTFANLCQATLTDADLTRARGIRVEKVFKNG